MAQKALWPTPAQYRKIRSAVLAAGWEDDYHWIQSVARPETPERFAEEATWVIINSGMHHNITRAIEARVLEAIREGRSVHEAFGHRGKAAAIEYIWAHRRDLWRELIESVADDDLPQWGQRLPWIGPITCYHLAKNLGADVAKPDRWLERVAAASGGNEDVPTFCRRVAKASGDRIATVDFVLWAGSSESLFTIPGYD